MPKFRENRIALLYVHQQRLINDEEFLLLYNINTSASPDFPYWTYDNFDWDSLSDEECKAEFRFYRNDTYQMLDVLQLPDEIICYNRFHVDGFEALCIMLERFAYPCRCLDVMLRFAKPVPQLCMASNHVMNLIYTQWNHLLTDLDQPWLSPANLQQFAEMINSNGGALQTCWAWVFVDGTVRPVSRPGRNQRVFHNGHKKVHSIKFQSVVAPNGLVANLYGPVEAMNKRQHNIRSAGLNQICV